MALLATGSKPITKRKPRKVYKIRSTLEAYQKLKAEHDSKMRPFQASVNNEDSDMNAGPYRMNDDNASEGMFAKK